MTKGKSDEHQLPPIICLQNGKLTDGFKGRERKAYAEYHFASRNQRSNVRNSNDDLTKSQSSDSMCY